ncbi:MAG: C39 family peptidase, partial [Anaerolineaceae bacterium]|nr:C39 family peptidase [Anaerolineaceae bacterium]
KILGTGDNLIHGFIYDNGYLWASTRTSPARIFKINPVSLDFERIILTSGLNKGEDIISAGGYIWVILYTNPAKLVKINPNTMTWEVAISFQSNEISYGGSLEYAFGSLWVGGLDRKIARVNIENLNYQIFHYPEIFSSTQFHALTSGGGFLWTSAPQSSRSAIVKINPNNPSDYSFVVVNNLLPDDMAYVNNHLYIADETSPSYLYKFANDLSYTKELASNTSSYGVFINHNNPNYVYSAHIGSPGFVKMFDLNLNLIHTFFLPSGFNDANEIAFDSSGFIYVTAWQSPAKIVKFSTALTGSITSPVDYYTTGPASVPINASAEYPSGPGVKQVEFYASWDGVWHPLGIDATEPYAITWVPPNSMKTQQVLLRIDVVGNDLTRTDYAGGVRIINFVQSYNNPDITENWISNRAYLNQRSLNPPVGDVMCSAASMSMILAMEGVIPNDHQSMSSKAIEMYPKVLDNGTAYIYKMVNVLKPEGTNANYIGWVNKDAGWNKIKENIDGNHPLIIRTEHGSLTTYGHFIVAVGYKELSNQRFVIAYDPYGEWKGMTCSELGLGCNGNYYKNSTDPSSFVGRWVFYDFDKIFGNYLIVAPNTRDAMALRAITITSDPDLISDEHRITDTYEGVPIGDLNNIFLPIIVR